MALNPETWSWLEKASIISLLGGNIAALLGLGKMLFTSLQRREWVPGWALDEMRQERDALRIENKSLLGVTLRAIRVTDRAVGSEEGT